MSKTNKLISRQQAISLLDVSEEFLVSLEREEIVVWQGGYTSTTLETIRICHSLHIELGVNLAGVEVALGLLDRIHADRRQFKQVLGQLKKELEDTGAA